MAEQKQFLNVIDRDTAQQLFHQAINLQPLESEIAPLAEALGRVLAADILSQQNVPSFDRSNYDGFAVRAEDTYDASETNPIRLQLLPESIATAVVPQMEVTAATTIPIATGGMLPRGADAVLMVEHSVTEKEEVLVYRSIHSGFGVACAGTDITAGEMVLRQGRVLTSRETGVLAAIGEATIPVIRKPKVAIVSTGDEIIAPGEPMKTAMVYDSNARILADAVRECGGEPVYQGIVRDDEEELQAIVAKSLTECDIVLLSGGTSKGEGDLCCNVVEKLNDPGIVAHGVALKPGKPICLAGSGGKPVVILPGFPTSAIFTFHEFVAPVIRILAGGTIKIPATVTAKMAVKVNSEIGRTEFLLVGLVESGEGLVAYPMGKGSGSVTTFSHADGFVTIDRHHEIVAANEEISVTLLSRNLQIADLVVIGSHCTGIDLLLAELQRQGISSKLINVGSTAGVAAARRGECDIAPCHLLNPATGIYNESLVDESIQLVKGYRRTQGIIFRKGDPRFENQSLENVLEAIASNSSLRMVNRYAGSGTRILIDDLLQELRPAGYSFLSRSHHAVATTIKHATADWGVAIKSVVDDELGFLPLNDEEYDFFIPVNRRHKPAVEKFMAILGSNSFQSQLAAVGLIRNHLT
ncbi:MAG: molybdopterin biosynthesis protein [Pirellulales bacterium]|jgi:putative molybdopterin biosynthesis protein